MGRGGGGKRGNFRGDGGRGLLFEVFFAGGELLLFGSGSPLIISLERPRQGKIEFIRPCINMNKKFFFSLYL